MYDDAEAKFTIVLNSDNSGQIYRKIYGTDEEFANFRAFYGGSMKQDVAYRSASPIDNDHNSR